MDSNESHRNLKVKRNTVENRSTTGKQGGTSVELRS